MKYDKCTFATVYAEVGSKVNIEIQMVNDRFLLLLCIIGWAQ